MIIKFFAKLKDFYGSEMITENETGSVEQLRLKLCHLKPEASDLLQKCRFAVNNSFVSANSSLQDVNEVLVMPPSSGG